MTSRRGICGGEPRRGRLATPRDEHSGPAEGPGGFRGVATLRRESSRRARGRHAPERRDAGRRRGGGWRCGVAARRERPPMQCRPAPPSGRPHATRCSLVQWEGAAPGTRRRTSTHPVGAWGVEWEWGVGGVGGTGGGVARRSRTQQRSGGGGRWRPRLVAAREALLERAAEPSARPRQPAFPRRGGRVLAANARADRAWDG